MFLEDHLLHYMFHVCKGDKIATCLSLSHQFKFNLCFFKVSYKSSSCQCMCNWVCLCLHIGSVDIFLHPFSKMTPPLLLTLAKVILCKTHHGYCCGCNDLHLCVFPLSVMMPSLFFIWFVFIVFRIRHMNFLYISSMFIMLVSVVVLINISSRVNCIG